MTCDDSRPCRRWSVHICPFVKKKKRTNFIKLTLINFFVIVQSIKREIGHLCCDEPPSASERSNLLATIKNHSQPTQTQQPSQNQSASASHQQQQQQQQPPHPTTQNQFKKQTDQQPSINKSSLIDPSISAPNQLNPLTPAIDALTNPINQLSHFTTLFSPRLLLSPSSIDSPLTNPLDQSLGLSESSLHLR
jgi:uncharacterized protein YdaU (DUF1376 family)